MTRVRALALACVLVLWTAASADAAWAFVQEADSGTGGASGTSFTLAFVSNSTLGNRAIVVLTYRASFTLDPHFTTVADSKSNAWTRDGSVTILNNGTDFYYIEVWSAQIATAILSTDTITATFSNTVSVQNGAWSVLEYSGLNTSTTALDGSVGTGITTTTAVSTSATSAAAASNELVLALLGAPNSTSGMWSAAPSGYTQRVAALGQFGPGMMWVGDKNSTASSTESESGTLASTPDSHGVGALVAIYKLAGGGPPPCTPTLTLLGVGRCG